MKKILIILLVPLLLLTTSFKAGNTKTSYIVLDSISNRILKGENINEPMLVASTAKILTAITVIENYKLDEEVLIKKEYTLAVGSSVYLKENSVFTRRELLYALMLRSANDAASALSDNNSNEFIILMNETAKKIGMRNSIFFNASGLDESEYNISTAYDMAILASYASKNSIFKNISSAHYYRVIKDDYNYYWYNKHKLVTNDESFIWGKTGYTKLSKRILISNYVENNMDLIVVTINDSNDWNSHKKLVNDLDEYVFYKIFEKGIHEIVLDKKYYLIASNTISMPILETELPYIQIEFIIYNTKALLMVRTSNILIYQTDINLYDKNNINIDDALEKLF